MRGLLLTILTAYQFSNATELLVPDAGKELARLASWGLQCLAPEELMIDGCRIDLSAMGLALARSTLRSTSLALVHNEETVPVLNDALNKCIIVNQEAWCGLSEENRLQLAMHNTYDLTFGEGADRENSFSTGMTERIQTAAVENTARVTQVQSTPPDQENQVHRMLVLRAGTEFDRNFRVVFQSIQIDPVRGLDFLIRNFVYAPHELPFGPDTSLTQVQFSSRGFTFQAKPATSPEVASLICELPVDFLKASSKSKILCQPCEQTLER